jgi:CDGSH-type Zn-finger protein
MSEPPTIECKPDGPYLVKNLTDLRSESGSAIPAKPVMSLCRCGGSKNKPFCDGTHKTNGFSGARLADGGADKQVSYKGKRITIHDNRSICAHAGHCTEGLDAVFKFGSEPAVDPDGASVAAIVEVIRKCPSGALSYTIDGVKGNEARDPSITVAKDGPYMVAGGARLIGQAWAKGASTERYTLCRCGGSRNKPFCDGTHWDIGFRDG